MKSYFIFFVFLFIFSCKTGQKASSIYEESEKVYVKKIENKNLHEVAANEKHNATSTLNSQINSKTEGNVSDITDLNIETAERILSNNVAKKSNLLPTDIPTNESEVKEFIGKSIQYENISKERVLDNIPGKKGKDVMKHLGKLNVSKQKLKSNIDKLESVEGISSLLSSAGYSNYSNEVVKWANAYNDKEIRAVLEKESKTTLKRFEKNYTKYLNELKILEESKLDSLVSVKNKLSSQYAKYIVPIENLDEYGYATYLDEVVADSIQLKQQLKQYYSELEVVKEKWSEESLDSYIEDVIADSLKLQSAMESYNRFKEQQALLSSEYSDLASLKPLHSEIVSPLVKAAQDSIYGRYGKTINDIKLKEKEIDGIVKEVNLSENDLNAKLKKHLFFEGFVGLPFDENQVLSLSPNIGYQFKPWFAIGGGINFNYSFNSENWYQYTGGVKLYSKSSFYKERFFVQFEYNGYLPSITTENEGKIVEQTTTINDYMLGGGINIGLNKQNKCTVTVMYKLNKNELEVVDAPWLLRLGMQIF